MMYVDESLENSDRLNRITYVFQSRRRKEEKQKV